MYFLYVIIYISGVVYILLVFLFGLFLFFIQLAFITKICLLCIIIY